MTSALGQRSSTSLFFKTKALLLPCVMLGESEPTGYEAGGLDRAQGRQAVPALSWPSHVPEVHPSCSQPAQGLSVAGLGLASEGQPL